MKGIPKRIIIKFIGKYDRYEMLSINRTVSKQDFLNKKITAMVKRMKKCCDEIYKGEQHGKCIIQLQKLY